MSHGAADSPRGSEPSNRDANPSRRKVRWRLAAIGIGLWLVALTGIQIYAQFQPKFDPAKAFLASASATAGRR